VLWLSAAMVFVAAVVSCLGSGLCEVLQPPGFCSFVSWVHVSMHECLLLTPV
jgi:hypothetical protein